MFDIEAFASRNLEAAGIEAEKLEDRGVDVGNIMTILDGVETQLVGGTVDDAPLDSATGQPHGEAVVMMVATVGPLRTRCAAELGRPDDDRVLQQPAPFEIDQQPGHRPVDLRTQRRMIRAEAGMGVPGTGRPTSMEDLNEANAALRQPARRQELLAERTSDLVVQSIELLCRSVFIAESQYLGHGRLHPEGQLVRLNPARNLRSSGYSSAASRFNRPRMPALIDASEAPTGMPGCANGRGLAGSTSR